MSGWVEEVGTDHLEGLCVVQLDLGAVGAHCNHVRVRLLLER